MPVKRRINTIVLLLIPLLVFSQNDNLIKEFEPDNYFNKKDSLKIIYGFKKTFIHEYELPAIIALSYYPELDSTTIEFKSKKLNRLGSARPKIDFIIRNPKKRHYVISINKKANDVLGFAFSEIPFNAQIGFYGHELAHINDYSEKSNLKLILFGITYLCKQKKVERYTDQITIEHELGWQLFDLNNFIVNTQNINENYRKLRRDNYLNREEILNELSKYKRTRPDK